MIITRLTMHNFGVYAGTNTFEFSHSRPIVLIGGMNGRGKTTFLEAILLSLYGSNSKTFRESRYRSYSQYLKSYVNKDSVDRSCFIELEFVMNEKNSEKYLIRREWNLNSKTVAEKITVKENDIENDFLTQNWNMFVENILPSALSSFYFFDGEKIAELAVDNTNEQMKESIRSMLGINTLDILKNDLNRLLRKTAKKISEDANESNLDSLRAERDSLELQIKDIDNKILSLNDKINAQKEKIEKEKNKYSIKGGDISAQREKILSERAKIKIELEQNQEALIEIASECLPLILVEKLLLDIKLQAEDEHNDFILQQALTQMEVLLEEYSKKNGDLAKPNYDFLDFVKQKTRQGSVENIYSLSDHALFQLNSLLEEKINNSKNVAKSLLLVKEKLKNRLDKIESYLSLDINDKELAKISSGINKLETKLVSLEVDYKTLSQEKARVLTLFNKRNSEFSKAVEDYLSKVEIIDDAKRTLKYTTMAIDLTEKYTVELQKRKTDILGKTITECYKKLANKKNLIDIIVMDPVTLDIEYLDYTGSMIDKNSLSAGEKQLMVIAILWALAICSKKKLPVIIDTPLSRLDSMHRMSLVSTYFPNASEQTIILSTDSEIDHNYYDIMKDFVGDEFTLNYNEDTKSTTILKGYFQV